MINNWFEKPITIMSQLYAGAKLPRKISRVIKFKQSLGFDCEHWLASPTQQLGKEGGDDGKTNLFKTRAGYLRDDLKPYLIEAAKRGHRVIIYLNVHWFNASLGEEYFIRTKDGNKLTAYTSGSLACPNGPFLKWAETVAEDLGEYDIAGVFLDGPVLSLCYCKACRKAFRARYGCDIPKDISGSGIAIKKAVENFPIESAVNFIRVFRNALNRKNPGKLVYFNAETFGGPGKYNQEAIKEADILGSEGGFIGYSPLNPKFFFKTGATAKLIESQSGGKPTVIYIDYGFKNFDYYSLTKPEIARMFAWTISNRANPWFLIYPDEIPEGALAGIKMNKFIQKNRKALTGTVSLSKTAVMYSGMNITLGHAKKNHGGDDVHASLSSAAGGITGDHLKELEGVYSALASSGIPFDLITEEKLESDLGRYKQLILPNAAAMTGETAKVIREFVGKGGSLFATHDTSLFNGEGARRKDYLLRDLFGVSVGKSPSPSTLDYISSKESNLLTRGFTQSRFPCPSECRYVLKKSGKALLNYYERMGRRYALLPDRSGRAAAVINRYGKGTCIFIPSAIGSQYLDYCFPETRILLENSVLKYAPPAVRVLSHKNFVEVSARKNEDGKILVHLINLTGRARPVENIIPLERVAISLEGLAGNPSAGSLMTGRRIKGVKSGKSVVYTLPVLGIYDVLVI